MQIYKTSSECLNRRTESIEHMEDKLDPVWKALSDSTRRRILDQLRDGPKTTTEITENFPELSRFGVMKHLDVLRDANLVKTRAEGRSRINSLNVNPIRQIMERWIHKYEAYWTNTLLRVKDDVEEEQQTSSKKSRNRA